MRKQDTTAVINRNNREKSDEEMLYFKYQNYILLNNKNIFNMCRQIKEANKHRSDRYKGIQTMTKQIFIKDSTRWFMEKEIINI